MKILNAQMRWMDGYMNDPVLEVLVDKMHNVEDFRYTEDKALGLYYGEIDGECSFFAYTEPGQGYGGRDFKIKLTNGKTKILHGPWSSRSGVMNSHMSNVACMECSMTDEPEAFKRGYTFLAGHITVEKAKEAMKFLPKTNVLAMHSQFEGEVYYHVFRTKGKKKLPKDAEVICYGSAK